MAEAIIIRRGGKKTDLSGVTATPASVLTGYRYMSSSGVLTSGTMPNLGGLTRTVVGGNTYSYSAGYYTGGTITAVNSTPTTPPKLTAITFTTNQVFTVPEAIDNKFNVLIFGGGGAGGRASMGSSRNIATG